MKVTKETAKHVQDALKNIKFFIDDFRLVFPVDFKTVTTDEFGIETTKYKAESHYGNSYVPVISANTDTTGYVMPRLAYCATTDLISFDLAEYFSMIDQFKLTEEDKEFLCQFECCVVLKEKAHEGITGITAK